MFHWECAAVLDSRTLKLRKLVLCVVVLPVGQVFSAGNQDTKHSSDSGWFLNMDGHSVPRKQNPKCPKLAEAVQVSVFEALDALPGSLPVPRG